MSDILVIKTKVNLKTDDYKKLYTSLMMQKENGIIIIPAYCEAIIIPDDVKIRMEDTNEIYKV